MYPRRQAAIVFKSRNHDPQPQAAGGHCRRRKRSQQPNDIVGLKLCQALGMPVDGDGNEETYDPVGRTPSSRGDGSCHSRLGPIHPPNSVTSCCRGRPTRPKRRGEDRPFLLRSAAGCEEPRSASRRSSRGAGSSSTGAATPRKHTSKGRTQRSSRPRARSRASLTSCQRCSGNEVIRGPSCLRSTVLTHSGFKTDSTGMPSAVDSLTSHGMPRIWVDTGITGI